MALGTRRKHRSLEQVMRDHYLALGMLLLAVLFIFAFAWVPKAMWESLDKLAK